MVLDGHIHSRIINSSYSELKQRLSSAGIDGGVILSIPPASDGPVGHQYTNLQRINALLAVTGNDDNLYPFFWIDPMEEDAAEQLELAVDRGVMGFKVICGNFYPSDRKAMRIFKLIAEKKKPILFHSGILWDGMPSSNYNRPAEFEALLEIEGLKFTLAHISWPWVDECLAVYGKFLNAYAKGRSTTTEMYIDITPGTPVIYREEALTKLFKIGYDVENNVIFGTDCNVNGYNTEWAREWIKRDNEIYKRLGLSTNIINKIYFENLRRFIGISTPDITKKPLNPGE